MKKTLGEDPLFTRSEVAQILNVTPLTISNREKNKQYPEPRRDINNYRVYSLTDILTLQLLTFRAVDTRPIAAILWDKGYRDTKIVGRIIDAALTRHTGVQS